MKKYILKIILLAFIIQPAHGMMRLLPAAIKSLRTFITNNAKRTPLRLPQTTVKKTQPSIDYMRFLTSRSIIRMSLKAQWQKTTLKLPSLISGAVSLTTATLLLAHKAKAQSKKYDVKQSMPIASLWQEYTQGKKLTRHEIIERFNQDCARHVHENNAIPMHTINDDAVRIATYNVHMWKDAHEAKNFDGIMRTISQVNADIVVLQEVYMFDKELILKQLKTLGYEYTIAGRTATFGGRFFGNMMVSKYPFASAPLVKTYDADQKYAGERRCYIKSVVQLPHDKKVTIYGTHLDVYDETETLRTKEIEELIADSAHSKTPCIIAADYNAVRKKDYQYDVNGKNVWELLNENSKRRIKMPTQTRALETLEQSHFIDSFTQNGQQNPRATVWSGTAVDFLYLNKAWQQPNTDLNLGKSYIYYSSASDHLPILMDMTIKK